MRKSLKTAAGALAFTCFFTFSLAASALTYTVKSGDTAYKIASKYGISLSQLQKANPQVNNFAKIYVGQKITVPTSASTSLSTQENQVLTLVNKLRQSRGLQALKLNTTLRYVARLKSQDMAARHYFSHTSPTYGSPFTMMQRYGLRFSAAGENIAMGQRTAQEVMNDWMNSPGHRANILSAAYTQIGVGCAKSSSGVLYWTQEFMKPM